MGWNDPQDNDSKKNNKPWMSQNEPPDLDELIKKAVQRFKTALGGKGAVPSSPIPDGSGGKLFSLGILALVLLIWFLSGIFIVGTGEKAAILKFGRYLETVGPGPHWVPRGIKNYLLVNTERVLDYSYAANMLTKDENLVSVAVAVQYKIGDLENYLFNVDNPDESLKQATSSALRQVVGNTTLDELITAGREAWGADVEENLKRILALYKAGIEVVNVSPQPARAPENVQDAFDDAIKAQEDERRFIEQARAYEAKVVPIAEGNAKRITQEAKAYAEQVVLKSKGDTAEFLALLPQYQLAPFVTSKRLYLDAISQILMRSTKVFVDSHSNQLVYLPLDKLNLNALSKRVPSKTTPDLELPMNAQEDNANRDISRPSLRMGRDE